jgi:hypothetical protein
MGCRRAPQLVAPAAVNRWPPLGGSMGLRIRRATRSHPEGAEDRSSLASGCATRRAAGGASPGESGEALAAGASPSWRSPCHPCGRRPYSPDSSSGEARSLGSGGSSSQGGTTAQRSGPVRPVVGHPLVLRDSRCFSFLTLDFSSGILVADGATSLGRSRNPRSGVRDELEQRPVRVAEVDAHARAAGAGALDRAGLDRDASGAKVLDRRLDRAVPHEAEVAVSRAHGLPGYEVADVRSRPVDVQALLADCVGEAVPELDYLRAQDVTVEGVRPLPVGDRDDDVVEPELQSSRSQ